MRISRRRFVGTTVGSVCGAGMADQILSATLPGKTGAAKRCLDYGLSFICNTVPANAVRFWVESRTTIIDEKSGKATDFYQCGACKSENTFAARDLFVKNNYDFLPILGDGYWMLIRRMAALNPAYKQIVKPEAVWGTPILKLRDAGTMTALNSWEEIRQATAAAIPIVTQTEISNAETGLRAIIECPTKTMNVSLERKLYQVDTGPIAFPDLTKRYPRLIECLSLAFIAFNAPHFADFVIEQPTPIIENGKEVCMIHHYSEPFSLPARNTLYALAKI